MSLDNSGKGKPETKQHHKGVLIYRHFQPRYTPRSVFEPCMMREALHTPGNTLGTVLTSTEESETKFFGFRYVFSAGSTELCPSVFPSIRTIWETLGRAVTFPSALPTCRAGSITFGPGGLGQPSEWAGVMEQRTKSLSSGRIWQ